MEDQALDASSPSASKSEIHRESRGFWVLTAYGISGLLLFAVLIYYFSDYVTH